MDENINAPRVCLLGRLLPKRKSELWHGVQTVTGLRTKSSSLAMVNAGSVSEPARIRASLTVPGKARRKTAGVVAGRGCAKRVGAPRGVMAKSRIDLAERTSPEKQT